MKKFIALIALLSATAASAAEVRIVAGADLWGPFGRWYHRGYYYEEFNGVLSATAAIDAPVARHVRIGGRVGLLAVMPYPTFGVPVDFELRFLPAQSFYLEGLVGPWIMLAGDAVRTHAAFGFGYNGGDLTAGIEVGYLYPAPILGFRLGFKL